MDFKSTRDSNVNIGAAQAIKAGISSDGGLFVPSEFPQITLEQLKEMSTLSFRELSARILSMFLTDYTLEELSTYSWKAYSSDRWGGEDTVPTVKLDSETYITELWHGPTCAFKDVALQMLPYLLTGAMKKTGEDKTAVILVATSGDTGKAALDGFKDVPGTKIIVFYPVSGVSNIQKLQMTTQEGENVYVAAINGNFDNAQSGVKEIFADKDYEKQLADAGYLLSSANSINFGRLAPQIVYYFSSYMTLMNKGEIKAGEKINFAVPTGNFGNILAGYYAKQMGLPVNKLICASNENNILTDFIKTGVYDRNREFFLTSSPSMDILISSNLERLLYHESGENSEEIKAYMEDLKEKGRYEVSQPIKKAVSGTFEAGFCTSEQGAETIGKCYQKHSYIADTHTAVAINVAAAYKKSSGDKCKTVIMSTANPFKFSASVLEGLGIKDELSDFEQLEKLSSFGIPVPPALAELKTKRVRFDKVYDNKQMLEAVSNFLIK